MSHTSVSLGRFVTDEVARAESAISTLDTQAEKRGGAGERQRVIVIQRRLPRYRTGVFDAIASSSRYDVTFCFGEIDNREALSALPFRATISPTHAFRIPATRQILYWHGAHIAAALSHADVLVLGADLHEPTYLAASVIGKFRGQRIIHWGHGISKRGVTDHWASRFMWGARRCANRLADAILLYGVREYAIYRRAGVAMENVFIAPNALDTRPARRLRPLLTASVLDDFRSAHALGDRRLLIYTGALAERKELPILLDAVALLRPRYPKLLLLIVGEGPELASLIAHTRSNGLEDHVRFVGPIWDEEMLARYYAASEVAVCPGAVGLFVNAAFAYGLPVVTNDALWSHGPEVSLITPGITGAFFKAGDSQDLASVLTTLLEDDALRAHMRSACTALVENEVNERVMAAAFDAAIGYALRDAPAAGYRHFRPPK